MSFSIDANKIIQETLDAMETARNEVEKMNIEQCELYRGNIILEYDIGEINAVTFRTVLRVLIHRSREYADELKDNINMADIRKIKDFIIKTDVLIEQTARK